MLCFAAFPKDADCSGQGVPKKEIVLGGSGGGSLRQANLQLEFKYSIVSVV